MKSKRTPIEVKDFSGGLNTLPAQTDVDSKYSPDCLNVYAEGPSLRKRFGIFKINSSSAGTAGNGFYNWVVSASQQYLMGLFDNTLKQMSTSGTTWSGTWTTVSKDSAAGTNFSNALMHFVTYQGTLIMTTEARDKPQRITATDTSYKNLDFGGAGIAPFGKYPQIWKEHVWILNIGGGGQLTENCISLSAWTTLDVSTGISATTSLGGLTTFRLHAGAGASSDAHIRTTVAGMTTSYSIEIKNFFATLGAVTSNDYAYLDVCNGTIRFRTRWSTNGLETFDGTTWNGIGVALVTTGTWNTWKFLVTAGTATAAKVDVFKDGSPVGLQFSAANASTASSGQIDAVAQAGGSAGRTDWYIDYLYINSIVSKIDYITNGSYETAFVGGLPPNWNIYPTQPYLEYKCNDNAGNSTVTDSGTGGNNGTSANTAGNINTSTISVAGKISNAFSLNSANKEQIQLSSTTVSAISADSVGWFTFWVKPVDLAGNIFTLSNSTEITGSALGVTFNNSQNITLNIVHSGSVQFGAAGSTPLVSGTWYHVALIQSGTFSMYVNGSLETLSVGTNTVPGAWIGSVGSVDKGRFGCLVGGNNVPVQFTSVIVDDFRYYKTAFTTSELAAIYAEGNGTEGFPTVTQNATTAFIKMGTASLQLSNPSNYVLQTQTLSSGTAIAGTPSYFGTWVYNTNTATYKIRVNDGVNNYDSAVLTANGTWQYQTISFTPVSNSSAVTSQIIMLSAGTMYVDQTSLIPSTTGITNDFSDRLQRSVSGTYDTWTGGDSGSNDITTAGDIGLTGSFILQDRMYIMKAWNIYRITYTGSIPLLDIKQARSVVGTKSPRAIKNIDFPGLGELVIFLGTDRNLYLFDGFSSTPLTDNIQLNNNMASVYTNNINTQAFDKVFAVNHSDLGFYEIFLPIGNSTVPNFSLTYNYRTKAFWPNDNRNFLSGDVSDDGSGQRVIMVNGATNGITYQLDVGTSDDGVAINSYWSSFKLGEDYILGKEDEIRIATDAVNATPIFGWRINYNTTYTTKTLSVNSNNFVYDPTVIGNLIQFKLSDNSTNASFKFWHVKILEKGLGIGS